MADPLTDQEKHTSWLKLTLEQQHKVMEHQRELFGVMDAVLRSAGDKEEPGKNDIVGHNDFRLTPDDRQHFTAIRKALGEPYWQACLYVYDNPLAELMRMLREFMPLSAW
jgi:hypothetical protein